MTKTILITGGTGLVGTALLQELSDFNIHLLTTQKALCNTTPAQSNIKYFYWNVAQQEIDLAALEQVDTIVHLAGASIAGKRWTDHRKNEILSSRVAGLTLIYKALQNSKHEVQQLVSASGVGWYGNQWPENIPQTENQAADKNSFLAQVCEQWEAAAQQFEQLNINVAILRTGMVLAPNGGAFSQLKKTMMLPLIPYIGHGRQLQAWICIEDLAKLYKTAILEKWTGAFNATAPQNISNKSFMQQLGNFKFGRFWIFIPAPKIFFKLLMGQMAEELLLFSIPTDNTKVLSKGFNFKYKKIDAACCAYLMNAADKTP